MVSLGRTFRGALTLTLTQNSSVYCTKRASWLFLVLSFVFVSQEVQAKVKD